ncbi:hypothetical protein BH09BAC4_BH09BAC4_40120 [soil metagenome]
MNCLVQPLSPNYVSGLLRQYTGRSVQQYIHDKVIDKAKEQLAETTLFISEIACALGLTYTQSFNELLKNNTQTSRWRTNNRLTDARIGPATFYGREKQSDFRSGQCGNRSGK